MNEIDIYLINQINWWIELWKVSNYCIDFFKTKMISIDIFKAFIDISMIWYVSWNKFFYWYILSRINQRVQWKSFRFNIIILYKMNIIIYSSKINSYQSWWYITRIITWRIWSRSYIDISFVKWVNWWYIISNSSCHFDDNLRCWL